jgi:hypothetical protein
MSDISYPTSSIHELGSSSELTVLDFGTAPAARLSPEEFAQALVARVRNGTEAIIQAGEIASHALRKFAAGSPERKQFFLTLVENGFLSEAEARAEGQSPKISKLCAIGENATVLRGSKILPRLSPGYSNMYEAVQLLREVRKHSAEVEESLAALLHGANGDVNREFLVNTRKELKRGETHERPNLSNQNSDIQTVVGDTSAPAELLLLTPGKNDLRHFFGDYADPDALAAFRLNQMVAKNAIALCIIEARDYPVVSDRILPLAGFKYVKAVHLLWKPTSSEITNEKIAIVATRTNSTPPKMMKPWEMESYSDRALAVQLAPDAVTKLHAFALDSAPGWMCLPGGGVWTEAPSLKGIA